MSLFTSNGSWRRHLNLAYSIICAVLLSLPVTLRANKSDSLISGSFQAGEELHYNIKYGFAKGAEMVLCTNDTLINGRSHYKHKIAGRSTGLVRALYRVDETYHSYTDPKTDLPSRARRYVDELSYKDYQEDHFDRSRGDSAVITRINGDSRVLPVKTMDVVALTYYVRNRLSYMDLKPGSSINLPTYLASEFFPLKIRYLGTEVVKTKFGKVECYRFMPLLKKGDIFEDQDSMTIWISTDENHIPVRLKVKVAIGALYCDLSGYKGLKYPFNIIMQ